MKFLSLPALLVLLVFSAYSQTRSITSREYREAHLAALQTANDRYPHTYTEVTDDYVKGKRVEIRKVVVEREDDGKQRSTTTLTTGKRTLKSYSIMTDFDGHTYCSRNGIKWTGPQEMMCPDPDGSIRLTALSTEDPVTDTAEYSVTDEISGGETVKIYRKLENYPAKRTGEKRTFFEETFRVDPSGAIISLNSTSGMLAPKLTEQVYAQTWDTKTKFKPVAAPK